MPSGATEAPPVSARPRHPRGSCLSHPACPHVLIAIPSLVPTADWALGGGPAQRGPLTASPQHRVALGQRVWRRGRSAAAGSTLGTCTQHTASSLHRDALLRVAGRALRCGSCCHETWFPCHLTLCGLCRPRGCGLRDGGVAVPHLPAVSQCQHAPGRHRSVQSVCEGRKARTLTGRTDGGTGQPAGTSQPSLSHSRMGHRQVLTGGGWGSGAEPSPETGVGPVAGGAQGLPELTWRGLSRSPAPLPPPPLLLPLFPWGEGVSRPSGGPTLCSSGTCLGSERRAPLGARRPAGCPWEASGDLLCPAVPCRVNTAPPPLPWARRAPWASTAPAQPGWDPAQGSDRLGGSGGGVRACVTPLTFTVAPSSVGGGLRTYMYVEGVTGFHFHFYVSKSPLLASRPSTGLLAPPAPSSKAQPSPPPHPWSPSSQGTVM